MHNTGTHRLKGTNTSKCKLICTFQWCNNQPPHMHTHLHTFSLCVSALWEICLLEEDITSRRQPARMALLAKPSYRGYSSGKLKTTLRGVQSIMEIQKPSSSCEWVMRRRGEGCCICRRYNCQTEREANRHEFCEWRFPEGLFFPFYFF